MVGINKLANIFSLTTLFATDNDKLHSPDGAYIEEEK